MHIFEKVEGVLLTLSETVTQNILENAQYKFACLKIRTDVIVALLRLRWYPQINSYQTKDRPFWKTS